MLLGSPGAASAASAGRREVRWKCAVLKVAEITMEDLADSLDSTTHTAATHILALHTTVTIHHAGATSTATATVTFKVTSTSTATPQFTATPLP